MRVFMGVGAWLLGVGAATAGSLLAVSLLGQGIAPSTSQQLTTADVYSALSNEAAELNQSIASLPALSPSKTRPRKSDPAVTPPPQTQVTPSADQAASWPTAAPVPQPESGAVPTAPASTVPASTVLTSGGGSVVARCQLSQAYLVSWSPAQGYETGHVSRGPAATAQVTFDSDANMVAMVVSCTTGVPTATTTVSPVTGGTHTDE